MNNLKKSLENIGLNSNQAKVYLSILKKGKSLITNIAKSSGLKRTSTSNYIEELLSLGYISKVIVGKRVAYVAEPPENILKIFDKKKLDFQKNLPELNSMFQNSFDKANVIYFEGLSGIRKEYEKISSSFHPIITFFSMERYLKVLEVEDMNKFIGNIMKNQNKIKDLMEDTEITRKIMKNRRFNGKSARYMPKDFKVTIDLIIWGDNVTMISFEKLMGVTIENKEIAGFQRNIHNFMWEACGEKSSF